MEVYYGNLWKKKREADEQPGNPIPVDKHFEYGGFQWVCPRIYLCKEGIVLDLCRKCDASAFKAFYDKWAERIDALSPDEQEQISKENPMNFLCDLRLYLDDKKLEGGGWSGAGWQPEFPEHNDLKSEQLMEEYGLSRNCGWYMYRASFPYQPEDYASLIKDSDLLKRLSLQVAAQKEQIYFDTKITTKVNCEPFDIELMHPLTGKTHQFSVGACSAEIFSGMPAQFEQDMIIPKNYCALVYTVVPELPAEECFCVQDRAPSDTPIPKEKGKSDKAASSIGIIGRSNADREVNWKGVCSSLTFEPVKEVTWKCSIHVAPFEPMEISLDFS